MHILDSWVHIEADEFLRLLTTPTLLALIMFLPGRRIAQLAAAGVALATLRMPELGPRWPIGIAWCALWVVVAWLAGGRREPAGDRSARHVGGIESGVVGLVLGLALGLLLVAAVSNQNFPPAVERAAALGIILVSLGVLHLMLRRDAMRGTLAFGSMGLGLQALDTLARTGVVAEPARFAGTVWLATAAAVVLAGRIARVRQLDAGSSWVSDAHDLHD